MARKKNFIGNISGKLFSNPYQKGLFILTLIFVALQAKVISVTALFPQLEIPTILVMCLFFLYAYIFLSYGNRPARGYGLALKVLFALNLAVAMYMFFGLGTMSRFVLYSVLIFMYPIVYYFPILILAFFLASMGLLLFRSKYRGIAYAFFIFAILSSVLLYYVINNHTTLVPADEEFIAFAEINPFLHGLDPYSNNVGNTLYSNFTAGLVGTPTYTTLNQIEGTSNYPALYFLASVPFYITAGQVAGGMSSAIKLQFDIFLIPLFLILAFSLNRESSKKPVYSMLFFLSILMILLSTPTEFVMMALLILAYVYIESKYAWILLGLCISIQELLWLPAFFLILYILNNYGSRKAIYNAAGALAVFLLINGYFIALNPSAFVRSSLIPLNDYLLPSSGAPFSYIINVLYGTSLNVDGAIFGISALCLALVFLYKNSKKLIGLFSFIPLLFTLHADTIIFTVFFIAFMVISLYLKEIKASKKPFISKWLQGHKAIFCSLLLLLLLAAVTITISSHGAYTKNFGIKITNQSASFYGNGSLENYHAVLAYSNVANKTIYTKLLDSTGAGSYYITLFSNMTNSILNCNNPDRVCSLSFGEINLSSNTRMYDIESSAYLGSNEVYSQQLTLYNGEYFYASKPIEYLNTT